MENAHPTVEILVVLAEPSEAETVRREFEARESPWRLAFARNLAEASLPSRPAPPALIIADEELPDGRGIRLLSLAGSRVPVPLVILARSLSGGAVEEARTAGALACLEKSADTLAALPLVAGLALETAGQIGRLQRSVQDLAQSEERYRSIVEEMPALVCHFLPDGTLTFVNAHYCRYFDLAREDLIGQNFFRFIPEEDRRQVRDNYSSLTPPAPVITYEHKVTAPNGSARWQRWTDRGIFDSDGKPVEYRSIGEDITGRVEAESALKESNRLLEETLASLQEAQGRIIAQERLAAVGQLAGGIAHNFNNALVSISLYSELLAREPGLRPEAGEWIVTILEQAHHAAGLTQQILDFSRRSLLKSQLLDLYELVERSIRQLQTASPENVAIRLAAGRGRYQVQGDPDRLQQALYNLGVNAWEAMPGGGELHFELERIQVSPEYPEIHKGRWILLTVRDTGTGIRPEDEPHIFEPYFTTKAMGEGSGLGLSQVYGIVNQHGGHIEVQTQPGEGTSFRLYFPEASAAEPVEELAVPDPEGSEKATILVVEDNRASRLALCEVLQVYEYRALAAADGQAALEIYRQEKIDLVISDLVMPVMGGIELLEALRKVDPDVKMLVHTGYPLDPTARELVNRGVVDWVQKPVSIERIIEAVESSLDNP